jgi:hypothetical protein
MTIPKWLLQFGSITGLLTFCFTIWDRLLSGRPSVTIRPTANGRDLFCHNLAQQDVVIKKIRCSSKGVIVAHNDSSRGIMNAAVGESFAAILSANTERGFPLMFKRGELVDSDCPEVFPFAVIVSWRKSRSMWLPNFRLFISRLPVQYGCWKTLISSDIPQSAAQMFNRNRADRLCGPTCLGPTRCSYPVPSGILP